MKRLLTAVIFTLSAMSFSANAIDVPLPAHVVMQNDTDVDFWCQNGDVDGVYCKTVQVSDNGKYVLVYGSSGSACGDRPIAVVDIRLGLAQDVDYDGGCRTPAVGKFVRNTQTHALYVQVTNPANNKVITNYLVQ